MSLRGAAVNPKILVSLLTQAQAYQRMEAKAACDTGSRESVDVEVVFAQNSSTLQAQQLLTRIKAPLEERPVGIVIATVAAEGLQLVAREAVLGGIGWVLLSSRPPYVDYLAAEFPSVPVS